VLTKEQGEELIALARESVKKAFQGEAVKAEGFDEKRGVFVTITKSGELRGCIGYPLPMKTLGESIIEMARAAAFDDNRFSHLKEAELDEVRFEVSVLSVPEPIEPDAVVVGRDGLIIESGGRSGLLLPQVPVEWDWNREEYLEQLCVKAGLPNGSWKSAQLKAFQAQVFSES
jgi:hypothetical protein